MVPDSPLVRRIAAIAAIVLVVSALAAVVVFSGGDDEDPVTAGAAASTTVAGGESSDADREQAPADGASAPSAPSGTTDDGADDTVAGSGTEPSSTEPTTAPAPTTGGDGESAAPADPGQSSPPKTGTYVYAFSREGSEGSEDGERTTRVEDNGKADDERRQRFTQEGGEGSLTHDVAWRSDGLYVMVTTFNFGGQTGECDWEPDFRLLAAPLQAGATWSYSTSCTVNFGTTPVKVEATGEYTVVEATRLDVAGTTLDVWKIESVEDMVFGTFGSAHSERTSYFSPPHGLEVKASAQGSGSGPQGSGSWTEEREIKNLTPQ